MKTTIGKFFVFFLCFLLPPLVSVAQTGPNNPGTAINNASYGTVSWNTPIFAAASDNLWSVTSTSLSNGASSNYLVATNFGFSINPCDNVTGIEVRIEWSKPSGATVTDDAIRLVVGGVIQSAVNRANGTVLPVSDAVYLYGNTSDPWGLSLTGADVNASDFGVAIAVKRTAGGSAPTPQIDHVTITLYHSTPPPMSYSSTAVSQISTLVNPNTQNNPVIRVEVNTNAGCPAIDASSFTFNMNGTTSLSDIENARLYFTGTSSSFSTISQLGSTVISPSGSFIINGFSQPLKSGINYFWLAVDVVAGATISNLVDAECTSVIVDGISRTPSPTSPAGSRTITAPVTVTVGNSGETYTTIQAAYNAIPASPTNSYIIDIYSDYNSASETFPIVFGNKSNALNIIVRPALGQTGILCAGSVSSQGVWNLDNAQNIVIDGRPGSQGTTNQFIVRNTRTTSPFGTAFLIRNDARSISFIYMVMEGETYTGSSLDGVVTIGTTTGTTGNDNINFSYCTLRDISVGGSGTIPFAGIFSSGTAAKTNDNIIVDNCKFPNGGYPAISFFANTTKTTVTNNHVYCPTGMTIAGVPAQAIYINSGSDHLVSGNFIGGTTASCGGTQFSISAGTNQVFGIYMNATGNNTITSNQFSNFKYITTFNQTSNALVAISINGNGNYVVGSPGKGNLIGNMSATGDVLLTNNGSSGNGFCGIENNSTGTVSIAYNNIGGVTVNGSRVGYYNSMISSSAASGSITIDNNTIGGAAADNILMSSNVSLYAIYNTGAAGITCTNNVIQRINYTVATTNLLAGIFNNSGNLECTGNNFLNITGRNTLYLVEHLGNGANISSNNIQSISQIGTSGSLFSIFVNSAGSISCNSNVIGNTSPNNITSASQDPNAGINKSGAGTFTAQNNTIQNFTCSNTASTNTLYGINNAGSGNVTFSGNQIRNLKSDAIGAGLFNLVGIGHSTTSGIIFTSTDNTIENLELANPDAGNTGIQCGIQSGYSTTGSLVEGNTVRDFINKSTGAFMYGIYAYTTSGAFETDIFNNVVLFSNGAETNPLTITGIFALHFAGNTRVYHNTVKISGSPTSGAKATSAFTKTQNGTVDVKNNIFQNNRINGGPHRAIDVTTTFGTTTNFNYLEVDASQATNIGKWNAIDYNFINWKTNSGAANDVTGTATIDGKGYVTSDGFSGAGTGTNLSAIVPNDKDGVGRPAIPWVGAYEGPTISTTPLPLPLTFCAGSAVSVSYTIAGGYDGSNIFTAQLSDAAGSFATPVNIGTISGTTAGTINATIPGGTPQGSGYRIRVVSSAPTVIGADNGSDIAIDAPPTVASAGPDQTLCNSTTTTLAGNTPIVGTGNWSVVSGVATVTTPSSPTSGVTGLIIGASATLRWTISNGICASSFDDMIITVDELPTAAAAGYDKNICGTTTYMTAMAPYVGTGGWSLVSGNASITTPTSPTSAITGLDPAPSTAVLRWTTTNGTCTSIDDVTINVVSTTGADGTLDFCFNPEDVGSGTGADNWVYSTTIQSDGKIIIGGDFTSFNGTIRNRIARLNTDGSLDTNFNPGTGANSTVYSTSIQSDGKIIIGGDFTSYNGTGRNYIARLNSDGSLDTGFDPGTGADNNVKSTSIQSDGKIIVGGNFTTYNGTGRNYIARLNADGSLDTGFDPGLGADNYVNSTSIQSDGKIIIGGFFTNYNGTGRSYLARLNAGGSLDTGFDPGTGANNEIYSTSIQGDGKIIIGGDFTNYNGTGRNRISRLNTDGSLDTGFNPGTGADFNVNSTSIQSDGKIIIGGAFTNYDGTGRNFIARLNSDGSLDTGFDPGTGADGPVNSTTIQSDGKIIIGGFFTSYNGTGRNYIARLNADGSLDTGFDPGTGADFNVNSTSIQSDGKIIIWGGFTSYNGTGRNFIARLNSDGSLDTGFDPGTGANTEILSTSIQSDGKIIIGGTFTTYNGSGRNYIARLNADGSLDTGFDPGTGADYYVNSISIQSDGKIIIGGNFTTYNGIGRSYIARLNADGSLDTGFDPGTGADYYVNSISIQSDGKIIIGGWFGTYNGTGRNYIARLNADGSLDTGFDPGTGANSLVYSTSIQSDGKIIVGGDFTSYNGTGKNRIIRVHNSVTSISTSAISPTSYCAGGSVSVPYTVTGSYNGGNIFTAQLSDGAGNFSTPIAIGTLSSQTSGTIAAEIPSAALAGAGYRIRVVSSDPVITGTDNGTDISISVCSRYWVDNAGNWNDVSHWAETSGGLSGASVPHKGVYVYLDNNSFSGPGQIITMPVGTWYMKSISFTGYGQNAVFIGQGAMVVGQ